MDRGAPFQSSRVHTRVLVSLLIAIALAVPVWWATTRIVRLPLPTAAVRAWQARGACPVRAAWHVVLQVETDAAALPAACDATVERLVPLSRGNDAWGDDLCVDWSVVAEHRGRELCAAGAPRTHATSTLYVPVPQGVSVSEHAVRRLAPLLGRTPDEAASGATLTADDHRVVDYAPRVRVVFSLLHEDASAGGSTDGWALTQALRETASVPAALAPLVRVRDAVRGVYELEWESQVQWYAPSPSRAMPGPHEAAALLSMDDMRVFTNAPQWALDSYDHASNDTAAARTLHMVLYVPSASSSPLYVQLDDGTIVTEPAWLVPQWGGVVVWNRSLMRDASRPTAELSLDELAVPLTRFASQLAALLGLGDVEQDDTALHLAAHGLQWHRTLSQTREAVETLASIVRLVRKLPNLGVRAQVRDQVVEALAQLDAVQAQLAGSGPASRDAALARAAHANTLASRAFFDSSMLERLYFPAEHNYAVYTPLLGPLLLPLLFAAVREWKYARAQRRDASPRLVPS